MSLNIFKCYSICFYRSGSLMKFVYSINNYLLELVPSIKDLDITYSFNLNFHQHITNIISKALKILDFVERNPFDFENSHLFLLLYDALVKSIIKYGSII